MTTAPRIPLPREKPPDGKSHAAFKFRNHSGASITTWGLLSDEACRQILAIIVQGKKTPDAATPAVPDPWRIAVDDAMVAHALDCTTPDSDPKQCVELLCKQVADIWRDIAAPAANSPLTDEQIDAMSLQAGDLDPDEWEHAFARLVERHVLSSTGAAS